MDAPKGRYRVEEKDGRLVVIDTLTGAPAKSVAPSPRAPAMSNPSAPRPPGAVSSPTGLVDRYTRLLLGLVVKRWDEDGRALVAWEWEQNGRKQRWDAVLGPVEQRRLGRALAALTAFPAFVLLTVLTGFALTWLLLPITFPISAWGVWAIHRLQSESRSA